MAHAHTTKAHKVWWAVGVKIGRGGGQQELDDLLQFRRRYLSGTHGRGLTARSWSRAAGGEPYGVQ